MRLYDGMRLPPAQPPSQQLLPAVPACMTEKYQYKRKLATQGYSKPEANGLGLAEPPVVEPSVAYHLHLNRRSISASSHITLPSKTEHTAAGIYSEDV